MNAKQRRRLLRVSSAALLLLMCLALSPPGIAQQDAAGDEAADDAKAMQTTIIHLNHGDARAIAAVVSDVLQDKGVRIVADAQSNSIIVVAPAEKQQRVAEIIDDLSKAQPQRPTMRVFPLQHTRVDDALHESLRMALPKDVQLNIDRERNMVVVYGEESAHEWVAQMLTAFDRPNANANANAAAANRAAAYRVHITWLIDIGPLADKVDDAAKRPLPDELKPVADELAKLGVKNLYVAARTMVRCTGDEQFAMLSRAKLIEPADLAIEGQFIPTPGSGPGADPGKPRLRIRLSGQQVKLIGSESTRSGPKQAHYAPREIVNIQTTITTPPGKPVVLGVSPMEDVTSAFVVTVEVE